MEKRDVLDQGAEILLEKEKIEGNQLNALMKISPSEAAQSAQK